MGSEMSCPCYRKNYVEEEPVKENNVIEDYFSKRFCKENLLFNFSISNIKLCVFSSDLLENFFKNKNTIKHTTKPSTVYNNINITNVLKNNDQCLVILEHFEINTSKNTEFCLTNIDLDHNKINLENIIENHTDFQVNEFNLLSNDEKKIFDLIQMNLNVMLKKDYILIGVINSSNRNLRDYKMLFKKSIKVENEINYHIYLHETVLTQIEINNVLSKNQDKKLKSVIVLSKTKDNFNIGKYYFFIFEKQNSKIIEKDFLVIDMKKKLMPNDVFLEDLATKLNNMHNQKLYGYKLSCIINDDDSLFLIMREEIQAESPDYIDEEF